MNKVLNIENIGEIHFVKSKRAKKLSISLKPFHPVKVTIPYRISLKRAEKFVSEKENWIINAQRQMQTEENKLTVFTENTKFKTYSHELKITPFQSEKQSIYISIKEGNTIVKYPNNLNVESSTVQDVIRKGIIETLRIEAKQILPERVRFLAKTHNLNFGKLSFRNAKTRWGSCSGENNISLNLHLMRLPDYLIDYVILHELAHTIEKNHRKGFWNLLNKMNPGAKTLAKELRNYSPTIY